MNDFVSNYALYQWSHARRWLLRGRFASPQLAIANPYVAGERTHGVVIDLVTGRMIWKDGKYCCRVKPVGIKSLPAMEVYHEVP